MKYKDWQIWIYLVLAWLLILIGYEWNTRYQIQNIQENWSAYCQQSLNQASQAIQQQFHDMEKQSFVLLDELIKKLAKTSWKENNLALRTEMFERLLAFCKSHELNGRGFAIYKSSECVAWYNYDFEPAQNLFQHGLEGNRFSSIATNNLAWNQSSNGVKVGFSVLCTVVPIYESTESDRPVGVAVAFLTLDSFYPLNTPYICNQSFESQVQNQYPIPKISITYGKKKNSPPASQNTLQKPLLNIRQEAMGEMVISFSDLPDVNTISSQDIVVQNIQKKCQQMQSTTTSILLLLLALLASWKVHQKIQRLWCRGIILILIVLSLRAAWYNFNFPNQLLPDDFNSPDIFHSLIFLHWSDSLCNLLISSLVWLILGCILWYYFPGYQIKNKTVRYTLISTGWFGMLVFIVILEKLAMLLQSMVKHSTIYLFDFAHLYPSFQAASIYASALCLGGATVFFVAWLFRYWIAPFSKLWGYIVAFGWLFIVVLALQFWDVSFLRAFILFVCVGVLHLAWPRRRYLRAALFLFLTSLLVYLVLLECTNQKLQLMVEDRAEELRDDFTSKNVALSLDLFEQKSKLLKEFNANTLQQRNLAFLIWAENSISEQLDNLHLMIFAKHDPPQANQKIETMPRRLFSASDVYFQLVSDFRLNLTISDGMLREWLKKQSPDARQIHDYLHELGKQQSVPICMGILPIYDIKHQLQGMVVLFSRHAQISKTIRLPQVFAKRNMPMPVPLLMASFEDGVMSDINIPWVSKNFMPPSEIIKQVESQNMPLWHTDNIDGQFYDNFYFLRGSHPKQTIGMIGYPQFSWLFNIFYFFQIFLFGLLLVAIILCILTIYETVLQHNWKICWNKFFCFEYKLLGAFILISGVPVFIMGILNQKQASEQIWNNYKKNLVEILHNAEKTIQEQVPLPADPDDISGILPDDHFCQAWGERYQTMMNIYCVPYPFKLSQFPIIVGSNHREFFEIDLIPERIPGEVFYNLVLQRKELYITFEFMGNYPCLVGYQGLLSPQNRRDLVGIVSIPMIYRNNDVELQIMKMMVTLFTLYAGFFVIVILVGIVLAYQISRPLARLMQGIHQVSRGDLEVEIPIISQDEFAELIQSFNQMTKDLKSSREKIIQAEKDAAWREMARQIAHEIKNPLTPMKLSAQHLQRAYQDQAKNFDKILEKGIHTIIDAIDTLSKTAASFSEFAKFTKPNLGNYALPNLINDCTSLFTHNDNITMECQLPILPEVITDPHQLKRVIINLLTNSVQAIQTPPGKVKLTAYQQDQFVILQIQDNGVGIPDSVKSHLFEPNFSTKSYGSGLGLAICKRAIDQMGGNITISSEEGQGTTVTIHLKIANTSH